MPIVIYTHTHTHTHTYTHTYIHTHSLTYTTHTHSHYTHSQHSLTHTTHTHVNTHTHTHKPNTQHFPSHLTLSLTLCMVQVINKYGTWVKLDDTSCEQYCNADHKASEAWSLVMDPNHAVYLQHESDLTTPSHDPFCFNTLPTSKTSGYDFQNYAATFPSFGHRNTEGNGQGSGGRQYKRDCLFALWHVSHHLCLCMCG